MWPEDSYCDRRVRAPEPKGQARRRAVAIRVVNRVTQVCQGVIRVGVEGQERATSKAVPLAEFIPLDHIFVHVT